MGQHSRQDEHRGVHGRGTARSRRVARTVGSAGVGLVALVGVAACSPGAPVSSPVSSGAVAPAGLGASAPATSTAIAAPAAAPVGPAEAIGAVSLAGHPAPTVHHPRPIPHPRPVPHPVRPVHRAPVRPHVPAPRPVPHAGTYTNVDGHQVERPDASAAGASARCTDGTYSHSQHRSGTCSGHGGVATWIRKPAS